MHFLYEKKKPSQVELSSGVTERLILLQLVEIKTGEVLLGVGETLFKKILEKNSTFLNRRNPDWITIQFGIILNYNILYVEYSFSFIIIFYSP